MGLVMTLDSKSIRFDFDKANITPEYRDILNRIAGILMTLKGYTIAVYGYTDDIGTQTYNLNSHTAAPKPSATSWCRPEFPRQSRAPRVLASQIHVFRA